MGLPTNGANRHELRLRQDRQIEDRKTSLPVGHSTTKHTKDTKMRFGNSPIQICRFVCLVCFVVLCVTSISVLPGCDPTVILALRANVKSLESLTILGESLALEPESMRIPAESLARLLGVRLRQPEFRVLLEIGGDPVDAGEGHRQEI